MTPIIFSLIYLLYLSLICQTLFIYDSIGYIQLGQKILHQGIGAYIQSGPQREPLYPLIIAAAMRLGETFAVDYNWILKLLHIAMLAITQILALIILKGLGVKGWYRALAVFYIGISPVLVNSAFWVYSEIAALPLVLAVVLAAARCWRDIHAKSGWRIHAANGILLGIFLFLSVCAKDIFEAIAPLIMAPFIILTMRSQTPPTPLFILKRGRVSPLFLKKINNPNPLFFLKRGLGGVAQRAIIVVWACAAVFYIPLTSYKLLNQTLNGHFTFTDRASWALYGNTARRQEPLNPKRLAAAFAYVPSPHLCYALLDQDTCDFWSYKPSDNYGYNKFHELQNNGTPKEKIDQLMISLALRKAMEHPFQYTFLTFLESLKMLFWETSKAGQVTYPDWVEKLYNFKWFDPILMAVTAGLSAGALVHLIILFGRNKHWVPVDHYARGLALFILLMLVAYAGCHSFFFVLQRYALPVAPLWIIAIAFMLYNVKSEIRSTKFETMFKTQMTK